MLFIFFWSDLFLEARKEILGFLVDLKTLKYPFEINWPLSGSVFSVSGVFSTSGSGSGFSSGSSGFSSTSSVFSGSTSALSVKISTI